LPCDRNINTIPSRLRGQRAAAATTTAATDARAIRSSSARQVFGGFIGRVDVAKSDFAILSTHTHTHTLGYNLRRFVRINMRVFDVYEYVYLRVNRIIRACGTEYWAEKKVKTIYKRGKKKKKKKKLSRLK